MSVIDPFRLTPKTAQQAEKVKSIEATFQKLRDTVEELRTKQDGIFIEKAAGALDYAVCFPICLILNSYGLISVECRFVIP